MAKPKLKPTQEDQGGSNDPKPVAGPGMELKPGDVVRYRFSDRDPESPNEVVDATVSFVHPGTDGRLLNLARSTERGSVEILRTPFRPAEDEQGHTWHLKE